MLVALGNPPASRDSCGQRLQQLWQLPSGTVSSRQAAGQPLQLAKFLDELGKLRHLGRFLPAHIIGNQPWKGFGATWLQDPDLELISAVEL